MPLKEIVDRSGRPGSEIRSTVHSLLHRGHICQDARDQVEWNHDDATFYISPSRREEIDRLIEE